MNIGIREGRLCVLGVVDGAWLLAENLDYYNREKKFQHHEQMPLNAQLAVVQFSTKLLGCFQYI